MIFSPRVKQFANLALDKFFEIYEPASDARRCIKCMEECMNVCNIIYVIMTMYDYMIYYINLYYIVESSVAFHGLPY